MPSRARPHPGSPAPQISQRRLGRINGHTLPRRWQRARQCVHGNDRGAINRRTDKLGALVPAKVFAPVYRDVANGVATSQGDYVIAALSQRMNTDKLVGDVVSDWFRHGENRPTVAFSVDVAHAVSIRNRFRASEVAAEFISGDTPTLEREQILAALASGEIKVVANCMV